MAKVTLEQLLEKKLADGFKSVDVPVESLGGEITIVKQPLTTVIRLLDDSGADVSMSERMAQMAELIYTCVPLFKNKELQAKYECAEPYDVVFKVLDDNLGDIETIANAILGLYGMDDGELLKK
ncbi:hypothetical protein [Veillonella sp.]|uniref:hypothetical protein n=1 Tax=Veillonella sp. TaxID=1926307 RepID=UPI0025D2AE9C|nr:hypothetical protein [Veillonella sp.]